MSHLVCNTERRVCVSPAKSYFWTILLAFALQDKVQLVQVATHEYPTLIFDMWDTDQRTEMFLRELMTGQRVKIFQNAKFDMKFLQQAGLPVAGRVFDTYIAGRLLRQKNRLSKLGLDTLAQHYLSFDLPKHQQKSNWAGGLSICR